MNRNLTHTGNRMDYPRLHTRTAYRKASGSVFTGPTWPLWITLVCRGREERW